MELALPGDDSIAMPDAVRIVEMLPRDGLQKYGEFVPTDRKVEFVDALSSTGVDEIEFTSFTHPDAVPALRDAEDVAARIDRRDDVCYRALVPNERGMERAVAAGVDKVNALVVVSDGYRTRNQGMTLAENLAEVERIVDVAAEEGIEVEAGVGTSFYCPFEGRIPRERTLDVVDRVLDAGVDAVTLATTMGLADPRQVASTFSALFDRHPDADAGIHLHDTNRMGLSNALVAMACGVDRFDTSACGLGGGTVVPSEFGDVGNVPTEALVNQLDGMAIESAVDSDRLREVVVAVADRLDLPTPGRAVLGGTREQLIASAASDSP